MNRPAILLLLVFFLSACGNPPTPKKVEPTPAYSSEKALLDEISRHPDSVLLRENLIQYYRENDQYDKAITACVEALQKDSGNARFWNIKGTLEFEYEDTAAAIRSFEKAVALNPDPRYQASLGVLYAETKDPGALRIANELPAGKNGQENKEGLFIKGLYYNYSGDPQKAIAYFDQCLASDYHFMDAYREKAVALYGLGRYKDALAVLEKATTLQNGFDEGYYWMGRCYEKLNRAQDAVDSYRMALDAAHRNNDDNEDARQALVRLGVKE